MKNLFFLWILVSCKSNQESKVKISRVSEPKIEIKVKDWNKTVENSNKKLWLETVYNSKQEDF